MDPLSLFDAPTRKEPADGKGAICKHLQHEAKGCDCVVLFLDCDKEGENICFEVMDNVVPYLNRGSGKQVYRARFSAVTAPGSYFPFFFSSLVSERVKNHFFRNSGVFAETLQISSTRWRISLIRTKMRA